MKKITIAGQDSFATYKLEEVLTEYPNEFDAVIITSPDTFVPHYVKLAKEHIHLQFNDIVYGTYSPKLDDIKKGLEWAKGRENIAVACHAGVSRSAALAYAITCQEVGTKEALTILDPLFHQPNVKIVWLASKILDNQEVWNQFAEWSKKHQNYDLGNFPEWAAKND